MADRKTQKLLDGLQQDVEREIGGVLQYTYQSSMVFGLRAMSVGPFLRGQAEAGLKQVGFLCDQIVNLGGVPKLTAAKFNDARDLKVMLEHDLDRERESILEFRERAKQADTAGELGLKIGLEQLVAEKTNQMRDLERILRGWQQ